MVNPTWAVTPPDWQVRQSGPGDAEAEGHRLDGHARAAGVHQDRRRLPDAARHAAGGAPRLFGRPRRGVGVHRADRRRVASDRSLPAGRHQRRHPAAGRQSRHGAGRGARRPPSGRSRIPWRAAEPSDHSFPISSQRGQIHHDAAQSISFVAALVFAALRRAALPSSPGRRRRRAACPDCRISPSSTKSRGRPSWRSTSRKRCGARAAPSSPRTIRSTNSSAASARSRAARRRARSRVRPAIGRVRLHHLERRLSHHQRACGRRRGRSDASS